MSQTTAADSQVSFLNRIVDVRPGERAALALSFVFFFCVLCSYYIVRPLRDEMAVALGGDFIQKSFLISFLVMLAAVPVFGWVVARAPRRFIVPAVYGFFIVCLAGFWLLHLRGKARSAGGQRLLYFRKHFRAVHGLPVLERHVGRLENRAGQAHVRVRFAWRNARSPVRPVADPGAAEDNRRR